MVAGGLHAAVGICTSELPATWLGGFGGGFAVGQRGGMAHRRLLALSLVVALCVGTGDDSDMLRAVAGKRTDLPLASRYA